MYVGTEGWSFPRNARAHRLLASHRESSLHLGVTGEREQNLAYASTENMKMFSVGTTFGAFFLPQRHRGTEPRRLKSLFVQSGGKLRFEHESDLRPRGVCDLVAASCVGHRRSWTRPALAPVGGGGGKLLAARIRDVEKMHETHRADRSVSALLILRVLNPH